MTIIQGFEDVINPLQQSQLHKKGLCDYVINVASGCIHGCTFCYVPSTPVIRTRQSELREKGVNDPQMDWGKYLFIRKDVPEKLETILSPIPVNEIDQNPETLILQGIQVFGSNGNF